MGFFIGIYYLIDVAYKLSVILYMAIAFNVISPKKVNQTESSWSVNDFVEITKNVMKVINPEQTEQTEQLPNLEKQE